MSTGEDEPSPGLNGRLRPRKSTAATASPQTKTIRKSEGKYAQDRPKRTLTPSKASPSKHNDLAAKSDPSSAPVFLCPYCDRKFNVRQTASKHARRIHLSASKQDNFIKCLYCNHSNAESNSIIKHMVDSHPNQYFACLDCHTRFPSTTELAEHKLNVCEKQKPPYRSKLRQKASAGTKKYPRRTHGDDKSTTQHENIQSINDHGFNGIVISCELKPSEMHDAIDIEDKITTNLILPPSKTLGNSGIEKNAVIVLDDLQWNKRIPSNFSFHNTDADQILSRLGVVHRSPRVGESRKDLIRMMDEPNEKFEKCFDTNFYSRVARNVQENLEKCLDGSFNFNPDLNTIKTRKSKISVVINTAEGFPILLSHEQFSRNLFDGFIPRAMAPKHKWKWDTAENDKNVVMLLDQTKRDSHVNSCIVTLISSLDIWTQLRMKGKFEEIFKTTSTGKKMEKQNILSMELKEILESRDIPSTSMQVVEHLRKPIVTGEESELPGYLGLSPTTSRCEVQPAVLSGEWVRPRCYVCCACGEQTRDGRALSAHIATHHPNAQVQHYEIVGETLLSADILKHLYVPPSQISNRTRPPRGFRDCTKCKKSITLEDLHQHMLDCAGDTPTVRRKCRYRPFGVRRRRPRLPDNTIRKKMRKDIRARHRQKVHLRPRPKIRTEVGDAETIRKMIADLPAKRNRITPSNVPRPRRNIIKSKKPVKLRAEKSKKADNVKKPQTQESKQNDTDNSSNVDEDDQPLKLSTTRASTRSSNGSPLRSRATINRTKKKKQSNKKVATMYERNSDHLHPDHPHPDYYNVLTRTPPFNMCPPYYPCYLPNNLALQQEHINQMAVQQAHQMVADAHHKQLLQAYYNQRIDLASAGPSNIRQHSNRSNYNMRGSKGTPRGGRDDRNQNNNMDQAPRVPLKHSIASLTSATKSRDASVPYRHYPYLLPSETNIGSEHETSTNHQKFENEAMTEKIDKPPISNDPLDFSKPRQMHLKRNSNKHLPSGKEPLPNDIIGYQESVVKPAFCNDSTSSEKPGEPLANDLSGAQELIGPHVLLNETVKITETDEQQQRLVDNTIELKKVAGQPFLSFDSVKSTESDEQQRLVIDQLGVQESFGHQLLRNNSMISTKSDEGPPLLNDTTKFRNSDDKMTLTNKPAGSTEPCVELSLSNDPRHLQNPDSQPSLPEPGIQHAVPNDPMECLTSCENLANDSEELTDSGRQSCIQDMSNESAKTAEEHKDDEMKVETDKSKLNKTRKGLNDCIAMLITKKSLPRVCCFGESGEDEATESETIESECFETQISDFTTVATELCIRHRDTSESLQESISDSPFLTPAVKKNKAKCELARSNFLSTNEHVESLSSFPKHPRLVNTDSGFINMRRNTYDGVLITGDAEITQKANTLDDMNDLAFKSRGTCIKCVEENKQVLNNKPAKPDIFSGQNNAAFVIENIKHIDIRTKDTKDTTTPRRTKRKPTKRKTAYTYPQNSNQIDTTEKVTAASPIQHDANKNLRTNSEDLNKHTAPASIAESPIKIRACTEDTIKKHLNTDLPTGLTKFEISSNITPANSADMNKHLAKQLQADSKSIEISPINTLTTLASVVQRDSRKQVLDSTKTNAVAVDNRTNVSQTKVFKRSPELRSEENTSVENLRRSSAELNHSTAQYKSSNYDHPMSQEYSGRPLFNQGGFSNLHKTCPENEPMRTQRYSTLNEQHSHYSNAISEPVPMSQDMLGKAHAISMADNNNTVNSTMARMIQVNRHNFENERYTINPECSNVQKQTLRNDKSETSTDNSIKDMRVNPEFQARLNIIDNNNFASCMSYGEYYARMSQYQNRFPNMYSLSFPQHSSDSYHKFHSASFTLPTITHPDKYKATSPMTFSLHESVEKLTPLDLSSDSTHYESSKKSSDVFKNRNDTHSTNEIDYEASTTVNFRRNYSEKSRNQATYPYLSSFKPSDDKSNKDLILESTPDLPQEKTKLKNVNQENKLTETQIDQTFVSAELGDEMGKEVAFSHSETSFFTSNSSVRFQESLVNDWRDISPNHRNINQPILPTATTHSSNSLQNMVYNPSQKCFFYNGDTVDTFNGRNCSTDLLVSQPVESHQPHYLNIHSSDIPSHVNRQDSMHEKTFLENKKIGRASLNPINDVIPDAMYENKNKNKEFTSANLALSEKANENHFENRTSIQNALEAESEETKGNSCNVDMSDKDNIGIEQDPELARKIAMLPRELVEIIGTMPKDHRNQLLNVLPQYVSNPVSTADKEMANSPYITVAQKSNLSQLEINQKTSDLNKLSVNTAISPSSIIPKKRHSPSQSTCNLNFNETQTSIRASLTSTLSERTLMNNDYELTKKTKSQGYERSLFEKDGSSVIDNFSERDSDDTDINVVDVGDQENKNKDMHISAPIPFYLPTRLPQDLANKPKTNEQTASLRAVRIKTTSARKSFSEEISKGGDERYTNSAQIVSSSQYNYGNLIDFKHKNTKVIHDFDSDMLSQRSTGHHQTITDNHEGEENEPMSLSRSSIKTDVKSPPPNSNPQKCATKFVSHDVITSESSDDVAVFVNKEHGHFLRRSDTTDLSCEENKKDLTIKEMNLTNNEAKEESIDATTTSKPNDESNYVTKTSNSHAMPEIEIIEKINEHVLTEKSLSEVNEVKETLSQYTMTCKKSQEIHVPVECEIQCTKTQSEAYKQSHEDDSDDDVSLAIIKLKHCNSSIVATNIKQPKHSTKTGHEKKRQTKVPQRRLNKKSSRTVDEPEIMQHNKLTEDVIINIKSVTDPSGTEISFDNKDELYSINKKDKNKKKLLHGNTTTASDDKLTSKIYELDVNKENNITKNVKVKKDDHSFMIDHDLVDNQLDEYIDKNIMSESKNIPRINTDCNLQSGDIKMVATTEANDLSGVEDSTDLTVDEKCDSFEESNSNHQKEKYVNNLSGISNESEIENRDSTSAIGVRMENSTLTPKSYEIQDTDMNNSNLENPELNNMTTVSSKHSTKTMSLKYDGSDLQLCSEIREVNVPLRRSRRGKSMYVDNSSLEDIKQAEQVEDVNKKTPLTMKRLILSRVEKDKNRERTVLEMGNDNPTLMNQNITDIEETEVQCAKKGKPLKRKKSPHPRRKSKKTKPININTNSQEEESSDASNLNCASENKNSILRELPPNAEHKVDGKEIQKDDENCLVIPDDAASLLISETSDAQENISEFTSDSLDDSKESNSTGKRKLENTKVTDLVKCKSKKTKYQKNNSQSDFDTDDEKGLLESKIEKHLPNENTSTGISDKFPEEEHSHDKLSKSCDESNNDFHKQINNANIETRITCYNRPISNRRPRASSTTFKEQAHYDPYDIDFEDMIESTEPIIKKKNRNVSNSHCHKLHHVTKPIVKNAESKITHVDSSLSKQAASNVISSVNSESDSDSSKSDVPLQKYVNEKALELELKNKNITICEIDHMRKKEPESCKAKSDKTEITLDNLTSNAQSEEMNSISNSIVENRRSSYKNKKQTKRVKKDDSLCESELLDKDQSIYLNKNASVDQISQKHQNKEKKSRRAAVTIHVEPITTSLEIDQQLRSDKFMENFGFYSERIPRKSNLLASKKISETFHMISNESDDSFFGYKEKLTKKAAQNENKKKSDTTMDFVSLQDSRAMPNEGSSVNFIQSNVSRVNVSEGVGEPLIAHEPYDVAKTDDGDFDSLLAQSIFDSEEVRNLENDLIAGFKEAAIAKAARNSHAKIHDLTDTDNNGQKVDSPITTLHLEEDLYKIDDSSDLTKKDDSIKLNKQAGVKDMMYPDIEEEIHKSHDNPKSVKKINKSKASKQVDKNMICPSIEENIHKMDYDPELVKNINNSKANTHVGVTDMVCPDIEQDFHRIDDNPVAVKKINKPKPSKQPGVKDMMYPEIEEIDMLEDKFDKIKRKRRSQAVAAKQIQSAVEASTSAKPRKQTEKKRATKNLKKSGQSSQVPTKGALKGFDGIKISIPTHDLIMPPTVSPPRQQKRRKKASTKSRKAQSDSESSCSEIDEGDKSGVVDKDIYEFKDCEDTELLELRPSTVMDRFRSMHNKNKFKQKEKDKIKGDMEKDKQKAKEKDKKIDVKEILDEDKEKIKEVKQHHPTGSVKRRKRHKSIEKELTSLEKKIENVKHKFKKLDERINLDRPHQPTEQVADQENLHLKKHTASEQPQNCDDDINKKDVDNAIPSTSGYVPDVPERMQESDYESGLSSPEEDFIVYNNIPDDAACVCPSDNDTDDSDVERGCGKSNCIYKNLNADKNAAIGNIFKNNAVRCEKIEAKEPEVPKPNLDQLFDSLFDTNPNNSESSENLNEFTQTQAPELLSSSPQTAVNHERNTYTAKFHHDFQITSKGDQIDTSDKESVSRSNYSSCEINYNTTMTKNTSEKTSIQTHEMHSTKYGDTSPLSQNETMSDFNSFYNFPADDKPKEKLGFSLMSEECTQVNLEDIIADEDLVRNKANGEDTKNNEFLKVPCRSAGYNSEDEFDIDKPEPAKKQYMHLILPAEKTSCYAQTEPKSDHSDNECCNQSAASKYVKGLSPVKAAKGETYMTLSTQSGQTDKSKVDDSSNPKDFSEIKSQGEVDMRVIPRSRIRSQKYDSEIAQKSNTSKSIEIEKTKSDAQYEVKGDDDTKKTDGRALKAPGSLKSSVKNDRAARTVVDEDNEMSPPESAEAFAAPASRSMVEKHSPRKSDEGISTSHDYSADALDQSYDGTGVALQRARRKCTVGKQNILAEHWSSESEFDGRPVRPNSADSVVVSARKKKSRKKEHYSGGKRGRNASKGDKKGARGRAGSGGRSDDSDAYAGSSRAPPGPKIRARPAHHYWSSDGEETPGPQPQHGWIVGDSHKKLVTMLAHAKGRKRNNADKRHLFD